MPTLTAALADTDPGIRKTAAYALGGFADPAAADALRPLVDDPVADVRWNAALALARLGDGSGTPVLEQMLDRRLLAQIPDITPEQQEDAMISALNALIALERRDRRGHARPAGNRRSQLQSATGGDRGAQDARQEGARASSRQLLSDRLAGGAAALTPSERFDYIRGFPVCPGSLPQQGRV